MLGVLIIYVALSSMGLTFIKMGLNQGTMFVVANGIFEMRVGLFLVLGAVMYVISFFFSFIALSKTNLTVFYPLSAGLVYISVCLLSVFLLKESVSITQAIGMGIILIGVIVMNFRHSG